MKFETFVETIKGAFPEDCNIDITLEVSGNPGMCKIIIKDTVGQLAIDAHIDKFTYERVLRDSFDIQVITAEELKAYQAFYANLTNKYNTLPKETVGPMRRVFEKQIDSIKAHIDVLSACTVLDTEV